MEVLNQEPVSPVEAEKVIEATPQEPTKPEEDLVTRVSKFVKNNDPSTKTPESVDADVFNDADLRQKIESIESPELKEQMVQLRKSMMRGANDKFQEIAEIRKELQAVKENTSPADWTPERVQSLLNDDKFVNAAKQVAGTSESSTDPLEYADEGVKAMFAKQQKELDVIKSQNAQAVKQQSEVIRQQQHVEAQGKYPNYNPAEVDQITFEMLNGTRQATTADIYKATYYEKDMQKSYELGRQDERSGVNIKIASSSAEGITTVPSTPKIEPEKEETSASYLNRIIENNIRRATQK